MKVSALRKQAGYGYEPIDEDLDALVERSISFVETMERLVE